MDFLYNYFSNSLLQLRCLICNVQSLGNKLHELHHILYHEQFKIVLVTETWLDDTFTHGILDPEFKYNINIYRKDRNRHGGGVCIFVSKHLQTCTYVEFDAKYAHLKILCIEVFMAQSTLRVFVIYRPPGTDVTSVVYVTSLVECIRSYCLLSRVNIVTGDLNCPRINWTDYTCPNDAIHRPLMDCFIENGFTQTVDFPTRLDNILDVVLVDDIQRLLTVSERPPLGLSDHSCIEFSLLVDTTGDVSADSSCYYKWHSADFDAITCYFAHVDWYQLVYNSPGAHDMWTTFIQTVYTAVDLYVPVKTSRVCQSLQKISTAVFILKQFVMLLLQNVATGENIKLKGMTILAKFSIKTVPDALISLL